MMIKSRFRRALSILFAVSALAGCGRGDVPPAGKGGSAVLASFPGRDPKLLGDRSGGLHVVYVENRPDGAAVVYRRLGARPAGPVTVSPPGLEIGTEQEVPPTLDRLPDGTLVTAYPVKLPGKWKSEIRVQRSTDGGATWEEPRLLHAPEDGAHSLLSSATSRSGSAVFAWLSKGDGAMGVRTASTRDGRVFTATATVDAKTCQCCGTELLAGRQGKMWLAYRDLEPEDVRDFRVLTAASDPPVFKDGVKLSDDRWQIRGCPETGARLAEAPDGALWAAWFTGGGESGVYVTSSRNGGASFAPRTFVTSPDRLGKHPEIGALPDGRIAVVYETTAESGDRSLQARVRGVDGAWAEPRTLVRGGIYPRFVLAGDHAALAFTCPSEKAPRVVVADWRKLAEASEPLGCGS
jgi:hypothetical protein